MNRNHIYYILFLALSFSFGACNNNGEGGNFTSKPVALGKRNKITVLADNSLWNGPIRDTFNNYFGAAYPIMPQPEPLFDIRYFSIEDLGTEPLRKNLRTYILLCNLSDKDSPATKMLIKDLGKEQYNEALKGNGKTVSAGVDKWANKQLLIYIYGKDEEALAQSIRTNFSKVAKRINQHDEAQLASNTYAAKINYVYTNAVQNRYGVKLNIPGDYQQAMYDTINNVSWFRKDVKAAKLNIAIHTEKYTSKKQFSKDYIIKKRDAFGKKYVSSSAEGSYMISNPKDLPVYEYTRNYGDMQTIEIRGIWEMVNNFIGGPYISYALYNKGKGEIVYMDCFIMNIGKDKRDLMQEMEYMVKTISK